MFMLALYFPTMLAKVRQGNARGAPLNTKVNAILFQRVRDTGGWNRNSLITLDSVLKIQRTYF